ncbi:MAG: alpha/beta fold hydrolase [Planctomycetes bacterium]|nr:alpha/beta fold hydrolase [Planctomycetota bacterium]
MSTRHVGRVGLLVIASFFAVSLDGASSGASAQENPPLPPGLPPGFPPIPGGKPGAETKSDRPEPKDVTVTTADGMHLAATFWAAKETSGAGVVLVHMFGSDRKAWGPVVKHFGARGISVLAIDLRGHGGSAKQGKVDLAPRVQKRDVKLFAEMHKDAFAAVQWLAKDGKCDPKRIALVGASVGCSIAIDTARQHPADVAAVLCMSPGANYLGLDSLTHLKTFPATVPLTLLVHRSEIEAGAQKLADARPGTRLVIYDDAAPSDAATDKTWAHGTKMLGRLPIVEQTIASFVAAKTGSKTEDVVLDGIVEQGEGAEPWDQAVDVAKPGSEGAVRAFRVGRRVLFGGTAPADFGGLRFEVQSGSVQADSSAPFPMSGPPQVVGVDLKLGRWAWTWGGMGSVPDFLGPANAPLFGKTQPLLRVVNAGDTLTFEGEWFVPALGDEATNQVRLVVIFDRELHGGPNNGAMDANPQYSVELPSR